MEGSGGVVLQSDTLSEYCQLQVSNLNSNGPLNAQVPSLRRSVLFGVSAAERDTARLRQAEERAGMARIRCTIEYIVLKEQGEVKWN